MSAPRRRGRGPRAGRRQRRMGQNFLADTNLLDLIVRESGAGGEDVVLEVGGGGGALTERLAPAVRVLHVIELDERLREGLEELAAEHPALRLVWGDAMDVELGALDPPPTAVVANLPYSIATPFLLRTIAELPGVRTWLVMVQLEIAQRLTAGAGSRLYGSPSVQVQLACEVEIFRRVPPEVFSPPPRVGSALVRMRRTGPGAAEPVRRFIRDAFAHRRKAMARSLELAGPGRRDAVIAALEELGLDPGARAESLAPDQLAAVGRRVIDVLGAGRETPEE